MANVVSEMRDALLAIPDEVLARINEREVTFPQLETGMGAAESPTWADVGPEQRDLGAVFARPEMAAQIEEDERPVFAAMEEGKSEGAFSERWGAIEEAEKEEEFVGEGGTGQGREDVMERIADGVEEILEEMKKKEPGAAGGSEQRGPERERESPFQRSEAVKPVERREQTSGWDWFRKRGW